jgi:hypothetical protein
MDGNINTLAEKLQTLNSDQIAVVEDFIDFLRLRGQERALARASAEASRPVFEEIWNNPEDDVYDAL